jgi:hypothetical protein
MNLNKSRLIMFTLLANSTIVTETSTTDYRQYRNAFCLVRAADALGAHFAFA